MKKHEPDSHPCGCCGKGVSSPSLRRLIALVEQKEAEKRAKEQAESKNEQKGARA